MNFAFYINFICNNIQNQNQQMSNAVSAKGFMGQNHMET